MSEFEKELDAKIKSGEIMEESYKNGCIVSYFVSFKDIVSTFKGWKPPKPFVVVPEFVAEYIERCKSYGCGLIWAIRPDRDTNDNSEEVYDWLFPNGCRLEDGSFPDLFEPDNLVRPDSGNQLKFARAWLDGYTVEKEKKYILKHIDLSKQYKNESLYLSNGRYAKLKHENFLKDDDMSKIERCHFTQEEIDKLNIGSYVKIRVEP